MPVRHDCAAGIRIGAVAAADAALKVEGNKT